MRPNIQLTVEICEHENKSDVRHQDATCTVDGYDSFHCDDCGRDIVTVIPAQGHVWDEGVVTKEPDLRRGRREDLHLHLRPRLLRGAGRNHDRDHPRHPATLGWTWKSSRSQPAVRTAARSRNARPATRRRLSPSPPPATTTLWTASARSAARWTSGTAERAAEPAADEDGVYLISSGRGAGLVPRHGKRRPVFHQRQADPQHQPGRERLDCHRAGPYSTNAYAGTFDGGGFTVTLNPRNAGACLPMWARGVVKNR